MTEPSRPSRFGSLRALKERGTVPAVEPETPSVPESSAPGQGRAQEGADDVGREKVRGPRPRAQRGAQTVEPAAKRTGRPPGKRSQGEYTQITSYVPEPVHFDAVTKLRQENRETPKEERRDFSDVVEALLRGWLAGKFKL